VPVPDVDPEPVPMSLGDPVVLLEPAVPLVEEPVLPLPVEPRPSVSSLEPVVLPVEPVPCAPAGAATARIAAVPRPAIVPHPNHLMFNTLPPFP
jgi:hypothetical protein